MSFVSVSAVFWLVTTLTYLTKINAKGQCVSIVLARLSGDTKTTRASQLTGASQEIVWQENVCKQHR